MFEFETEEDKIKNYLKSTPKQRLNWLYEMNKLRLLYPEKIKVLHKKFKEN